MTWDRSLIGTTVSSTNKTDRHDVTEILLKVALFTLNQYSNTFDFERHLMKVILSVHDEGYFERHLMKVIPQKRRAH